MPKSWIAAAGVDRQACSSLVVLAIYGGALRLARRAAPEHDPEKLELDFRKDHAQTKR
jgi:hypothetical protein